MKAYENFNVVNKKDIRIGLDEKWVCGVRNTGQCEKNDKKVELFVKISASLQPHGLKKLEQCEKIKKF